MTIREIIKQKNREFSEDELIGKFMCKEVFTQDATERKIRAAEYFAPILKEKFGEKYPLLDWEEESAKLTVLTYSGPDDINKELTSVPAIAIYFLDSIYQSENGKEKIRQLAELVKNDVDFKKAGDDAEEYFYNHCTLDAGYPVYPASLIDGICQYIAFRNIDYDAYSKLKSFTIDYPLMCDPYTSSLEKDTKGIKSKTRKIFLSILEMVPRKAKDEAVDEYKRLFFSLIDSFLESRDNIEKAKIKIEGKLEYMKFRKNEELSSPSITPAEFRKIQDDYFDRLDKLMIDKEKLNFTEVNFNDNYTLGLFAIPSILARYTEPFRSIGQFDPYKVITGYFLLLESGDNYAWLMDASLAPLGFASYRLPWTDAEFSCDEEAEEVRKSLDNHHWSNNDIYTPVMKKETLGIEDEILCSNLSVAKAVYILTGAVPPRFNISIPGRKELINEIGDNLYCKFRDLLNFSYTTQNKINDISEIDTWLTNIQHYHSVSKELHDTKEKLERTEEEKKELERKNAAPDIALKKEIDSLRKKIEELNCLLADENVEKEKLRKKIAGLKSEYRNEKEELYSLRELIFSRSGDNPAEEESSPDIEYPYRSGCSILVIGGLPDWLKRMKNLLPDVKFFGDRAPQKEVLKHTDIVWFQTYAGLSHKTFYKTTDDLKALDIPIKYCPTSGVYRSAEAIVIDDEKRRNRK